MPVRTVRLGLELRQIRQEKNLTLKEASKLTQRSISSLSRVENGQVKLPERDLPLILDAYGIKDKRRRAALLSLARDAHEKHWWQQYDDVLTTAPDLISLENEATSIRTFEALFIPGLLQDRDYAYSLFAAGLHERPSNVLKRLTDVRMTRQGIFERTHPPSFQTIISEGALHQLVGTRQIMRRQLRSLVGRAATEHVSLRVLPFTAGAHPADGSFALLTVPNLGGDVVNIDDISGPGFVDDAGAVGSYTLLFNRLRSFAPSERRSRDLIERLAAEL